MPFGKPEERQFVRLSHRLTLAHVPILPPVSSGACTLCWDRSDASSSLATNADIVVRYQSAFTLGAFQGEAATQALLKLAKQDGGTWKSTLSDEKTVKGLTEFQKLFETASNAPVTENDSTPWVNINNDKSGAAPTAATIATRA